MQCEVAERSLLAAVDEAEPGNVEADAEAASDTELEAHVAVCLRCRVELARHRRIRAELGNLRAGPEATADGLYDEILRTLDGARADRADRRVRYLACAVVVGAGAAGACVVAARVRGRRSAA